MKNLSVLRVLLIFFFSFLVFHAYQKSFVSPKIVVLAQEATLVASPTPIDYPLPYPGILPDHILYPLKVIRDRILLFFTRDPIKRIELKVHLADKRLVMGKLLVERGKVERGISTISKGEKYLIDATSDLAKLLPQPQVDSSLVDRLITAAYKHQEIIKEFSDRVPEEERESLEQVFQLSKEVEAQLKALKQGRSE